MSDKRSTGTIIRGFKRRGTASQEIEVPKESGGNEAITDAVTKSLDAFDESMTPWKSESDETESESKEVAPSAPAAPAAFQPPIPTSFGPSEESAEDIQLKLSRMPLAVLLPSLGSVTDLAALRDSLVERHAELLELRSSSSGEDAGQRSGEDSMLTQVLNWLSLGDSNV